MSSVNSLLRKDSSWYYLEMHSFQILRVIPFLYWGYYKVIYNKLMVLVSQWSLKVVESSCCGFIVMMEGLFILPFHAKDYAS